MFVDNKFAGFPPVHPIARHQGIKETCQQIGRALPVSPLSNAWMQLKGRIQNWNKRRIDRQAFQHMLALEDPILNDIGISRADVIWASKLPLSLNAALELEKIARQDKTV